MIKNKRPDIFARARDRYAHVLSETMFFFSPKMSSYYDIMLTMGLRGRGRPLEPDMSAAELNEAESILHATIENEGFRPTYYSTRWACISVYVCVCVLLLVFPTCVHFF